MIKYSIITLLLLSGCGDVNTPAQQYKMDVVKFNVTKGVYGDDFYTIKLDSCEYVVYSGNRQGGIIHKQNCKNHGK